MKDMIERQAAIDALDVLCQEHRYKIPGKIETYSQYNEAWQDALDRAEGAIFNLPSAQPDEEKISDLLYDVYRLTCPQLGTGGVALLKSYIFMVYREIFGEEGPEWMR